MKKLLMLSLLLAPSFAMAQTYSTFKPLGGLDPNTIVPVNGITNRTIGNLIPNSNIMNYGASASASGETNGTAVTNAISAAQSGNMWIDFPYNSSGYTITGTFSNNSLGYFNFANNVLSGSGIGSPQTGEGTLNSLYTNPWLIVTGIKREHDPASHIVPNSGSALIGEAIECLPNHPVTGDASSTSRMIACVYRGADTGTGGASGTAYTTEVDNDVLNLNTNSGSAYEIDVNFNGKVVDGGWSRGIFLTGGGATGNNTNSVAIDINHEAYDGTVLPWTTGISIRHAANMLEMYESTASEAGFFIQTFDNNNVETSHIDKNGYSKAAGYATTGTVSAGTVSTGTLAVTGDSTISGTNNVTGAENVTGLASLNGGVSVGSYLHSPSITLAGSTYSTLAACSGTYLGQQKTVTDSSVNTWGSTVAGGGSYVVLAFCNGTNWTVVGK